MIFGKNKDEFDFDSFKSDVTRAADPLVQAVTKYDPNKKHRRYKSPISDLPENAGLFFSAAADALDKKHSTAQNLTDNASDLSLDKFAKQSGKLLSDTVKDAKLDKKFNKAVDSVKDAKLDKKLGKIAKDAKLDKKFNDAVDTVKDAHLDRGFGNVVDSVSGAFLSAANSIGDIHLDKTFGNVMDSVSGSVKDAKLDKRFNSVVDSVSGSVKDAHLDKRFGNIMDSVSGSVKDAHLDKRFNSVVDSVSHGVKDAHLDKRFGQVADSVSSSVSGFIKDNKLDKKTNKFIGEATKAENLFDAANIIPGVHINPKKAAKEFRKNKAKALKAVGSQQKQLGKLVTTTQKDATKFVKARQKDIESGKIRVPFVEPKKKKSGWGKTGVGLVSLAALFGGLALNNSRIWGAVAPLESKLTGDSRYYRSRQGIVFYKEAGETKQDETPVVFVHGIGAGNHSYEWINNFEEFSKHHKTYAYDLLGFGNSDRPPLRYTAEVYIKQLTEFLDDVVGQPAYVVASSLSASYAVQVAYRRPELIKKLVLVSPTGINRAGGKPAVQMVPDFTYYLLTAPIIGKALYSGVASTTSIRAFMENNMFYEKSFVNDDMVEQYYTAAHQVGSEYAPPSFFTGLLDAEIGETMSKIDKPILMVYGKHSQITPLWEAEALKRKNPKARLEILDRARLTVQWEQADAFNRLALDFLKYEEDTTGAELKASDKAGVGFTQTADTKPVTTDTKPTNGSNPAEQTKSVEQAKPATDTKLVEQAKPATDTKPVEQAKPAADTKAVEQAKPATTQAKPAEQNRPNNNQGQQNRQGQQNQGQQNKQNQKGGGNNRPNNQQNQAKPADKPTAPKMEAEGEYAGDHDLMKELHEHREAFIGDDKAGAALIVDEDNNGVDDRPMGNSKAQG